MAEDFIFEECECPVSIEIEKMLKTDKQYYYSTIFVARYNRKVLQVSFRKNGDEYGFAYDGVCFPYNHELQCLRSIEEYVFENARVICI